MESLMVATAVACATMGGVFFTFSTFVMQALKRLPPQQGMAAMQSINVVAVTPVFMTALFGTAVACLAVAGFAVTDWRGESSAYLLAGSLTYVIGTIVVTLVFNVPLNNALAAANPASGDAVWVWTKYARTWTLWNHVRTVSGVLAAALFLVAAFVEACP